MLGSYSYDFADRPTGLTVEVGTDPAKTVASGGAYLPSGPLTALDLGNGVSELRVHDGRYAPERFGVTGLDPCREFCTCEHERQHERDLNSPRVRNLLLDGIPTQQIVNWLECRAYNRGTFCLQGFARGGIP